MTLSFSIPDWVLFFVAGYLIAAIADTMVNVIQYFVKRRMEKKQEQNNG